MASLQQCYFKFAIISAFTETEFHLCLRVFQVAKDPQGKEINALEQHITNLLSPSTPFFFNTLYDPYRAGADFVRGYPFSMREGVSTAISHGLWLNVPDYDAPTQLVKPSEKNTRFELRRDSLDVFVLCILTNKFRFLLCIVWEITVISSW